MPPEYDDEDACAWMWTLWADSGHLERGCSGWSFDACDGALVCSCGETLWRLEPVGA